MVVSPYAIRVAPPPAGPPMRIHPTSGRVYARIWPGDKPWVPLHGGTHPPHTRDMYTDRDVFGWRRFATEPATSSRGRRT